MSETIMVRDGSEWARFFYHEAPPLTMRDNSRSYSATWCCVSSFGVFGHCWSSMGQPFAEFIQDIETDYLLRKIGRKVTVSEKAFSEVRRLILQCRREDRITKDEARAAMDDIATIECEGGHPEVALNELYWSVPISRVGIEWCDLTTQDWDTDSVLFAKKLWPLFVQAVQRRVAIQSGWHPHEI